MTSWKKTFTRFLKSSILMGLYKKTTSSNFWAQWPHVKHFIETFILKSPQTAFRRNPYSITDSWGIREWSQSDFWKQQPHMKHPVKKIHHKVSTKCFYKVHVSSNLVIPWKVEAIRFLSKALDKIFHNKVFQTRPGWFLFYNALLVSTLHEQALLAKEIVYVYIVIRW